MEQYLMASFPGGASGKNPPANTGAVGDTGSLPERACQPTPVFLPGKSHGQRNLAGYSPWSRKELDATK